MLDILKTMLTYHGAFVVAAESGKEALEHLTQMRVDLIVSDISMPGLTGLDFIRQVRAMPMQASHRTPALALTAFTQPEHRAAALESGFDVFHPKPFDPAVLVVQIAHLARPREGAS